MRVRQKDLDMRAASPLQLSALQAQLESRKDIVTILWSEFDISQPGFGRQVVLNMFVKSQEGGWLGGSSPDFHTPKV